MKAYMSLAPGYRSNGNVSVTLWPDNIDDLRKALEAKKNLGLSIENKDIQAAALSKALPGSKLPDAPLTDLYLTDEQKAAAVPPLYSTRLKAGTRDFADFFLKVLPALSKEHGPAEWDADVPVLANAAPADWKVPDRFLGTSKSKTRILKNILNSGVLDFSPLFSQLSDTVTRKVPMFVPVDSDTKRPTTFGIKHPELGTQYGWGAYHKYFPEFRDALRFRGMYDPVDSPFYNLTSKIWDPESGITDDELNGFYDRAKELNISPADIYAMIREGVVPDKYLLAKAMSDPDTGLPVKKMMQGSVDDGSGGRIKKQLKSDINKGVDFLANYQRDQRRKNKVSRKELYAHLDEKTQTLHDNLWQDAESQIESGGLSQEESQALLDDVEERTRKFRDEYEQLLLSPATSVERDGDGVSVKLGQILDRAYTPKARFNSRNTVTKADGRTVKGGRTGSSSPYVRSRTLSPEAAARRKALKKELDEFAGAVQDAQMTLQPEESAEIFSGYDLQNMLNMYLEGMRPEVQSEKFDELVSRINNGWFTPEMRSLLSNPNYIRSHNVPADLHHAVSDAIVDSKNFTKAWNSAVARYASTLNTTPGDIKRLLTKSQFRRLSERKPGGGIFIDDARALTELFGLEPEEAAERLAASAQIGRYAQDVKSLSQTDGASDMRMTDGQKAAARLLIKGAVNKARNDRQLLDGGTKVDGHITGALTEGIDGLGDFSDTARKFRDTNSSHTPAEVPEAGEKKEKTLEEKNREYWESLSDEQKAKALEGRKLWARKEESRKQKEKEAADKKEDDKKKEYEDWKSVQRARTAYMRGERLKERSMALDTLSKQHAMAVNYLQYPGLTEEQRRRMEEFRDGILESVSGIDEHEAEDMRRAGDMALDNHLSETLQEVNEAEEAERNRSMLDALRRRADAERAEESVREPTAVEKALMAAREASETHGNILRGLIDGVPGASIDSYRPN